MKTVSINLYSFDELPADAKDKAIIEHKDFLDSQPDWNDEGTKLNTYRKHGKKEVIESILINEYLFFYNGDLAWCTTYTDGHPKAGTTELKLHGQIYNIAS